MKTKSVIEMSYGELEELAVKHFNLTEYNFVASEECGNDSTHEFTVSVDELADYEKEDWDKAIASKGRNGLDYQNGLLLNMLHKVGAIPAGNYLIDVCW